MCVLESLNSRNIIDIQFTRVKCDNKFYEWNIALNVTKCCPVLNADVNVRKHFMKVFNVMLLKFQISSVIAETK